MPRLYRRLVLAILLACLPFQTVVGATGILCAAGDPGPAIATGPLPGDATAAGSVTAMHDGGGGAHASHGHAARADAPPAHGADRRVDTVDAPAAAQDATHASVDHAGSDTCRFCMECCASAAPVPAASDIRPHLARLLRLPSLSSHVHSTQAGDTLYRPPRIALV